MPFARFVLLTVMLAAAACGRSGSEAPGQPQAAPPAMPVGILTLTPKSIAETSDFIASLRSLRSTTVQPDADGIVTRIFVKAGDRVRAGAPLVQINAQRQQAAVRSAEATRTGSDADVQYWRQQVARLETLVTAGAISKQEFEQAQNQLRTAEARLAANDAEVREGQVQLGYYRVDAPQSGTIGEIPVRVGDRITSSTVITTIDENSALELYLQVPLDRSPDLKVGLPVQLLDSKDEVVGTSTITFVAPRVDDQTQTVLAKSALKSMPESMRVQQFVKARVVWRTAEGLTVPVTAVTRISGQFFCFLAEAGPQGGLVAKQKPLEVGELLGNDYVVKSGLKAGDRVIVSGIQKLGDGAPVQAEAATPPAPTSAPAPAR
jgi:RND family efflux transporter MFP subunit